jgi:ACS family sodium-dependent inorganic phosphate cotransporter-like MFS transporter 5
MLLNGWIYSIASAILWGSAHLVNIMDVAGPFSSLLFGISNTMATIPGIVAPYLVGVITKNVFF